MNIQYLMKNGQREYVVLPVSEFEQLLDAADISAIRAAQDEEDFPADMVKRLVNGESPLLVWREHRQLTQVDLATSTGVSQVYISQIENGKRAGGLKTLGKLAKALDCDVDDLMVEDA